MIYQCNNLKENNYGTIYASLFVSAVLLAFTKDVSKNDRLSLVMGGYRGLIPTDSVTSGGFRTSALSSI
jgi:hypothetical protein